MTNYKMTDAEYFEILDMLFDSIINDEKLPYGGTKTIAYKNFEFEVTTNIEYDYDYGFECYAWGIDGGVSVDSFILVDGEFDCFEENFDDDLTEKVIEYLRKDNGCEEPYEIDEDYYRDR